MSLWGSALGSLTWMDIAASLFGSTETIPRSEDGRNSFMSLRELTEIALRSLAIARLTASRNVSPRKGHQLRNPPRIPGGNVLKRISEHYTWALYNRELLSGICGAHRRQVEHDALWSSRLLA